mmetsp:Transcript_73015/g.171182  ORF Transcript_73015/g.171182 Transcript_73015/m.171182 type:complete len:281 (-) Transcript_73015:494-1336(-)
MEALYATEPAHVPKPNNAIEIHAHELIVRLRHLAQARNAALMALQSEGKGASAGIPDGDVVVEAGAEQHLALLAELQACEAFRVALEDVCPRLLDRVEDLHACVQGRGCQTLQRLQPLHHLYLLGVPVLELQAFLWLQAASSRRLHSQVVFDVPAPESLREVVRCVQSLDLRTPAQDAYDVFQTPLLHQVEGAAVPETQHLVVAGSDDKINVLQESCGQQIALMSINSTTSKHRLLTVQEKAGLALLKSDGALHRMVGPIVDLVKVALGNTGLVVGHNQG